MTIVVTMIGSNDLHINNHTHTHIHTTQHNTTQQVICVPYFIKVVLVHCIQDFASFYGIDNPQLKVLRKI